MAIRNKNIKVHRAFTTTALSLSVLFLVSYVAFHLTTESTKFGGEGWIRSVYLFILITHIVLSTGIIPLVLFTYARGLGMQVEKHRRLAKITWPIWLYVTATGVIVYLMISYYPLIWQWQISPAILPWRRIRNRHGARYVQSRGRRQRR